MSDTLSKKSQDKPLDRWYSLLVDEEDARVCKDIPESACTQVPANFFLILATQFLTKLADSLANAKTVLPWLLNASGAPAGLTALLVPIRESGSLIPQLLIGGWVRKHAIRKYFFVAGCVAQALFMLAILYSGMTFTGWTSGIAVIGCLILFSLSRGVCSVSSKDVVGKTIPKTRRGRLTGISSSASGLITIGIAVAMYFGLMSDAENFVPFLILASVAWLIGATIYSFVDEQAGETDGGKNGIKEAFSKFSLLKTDKAFRRFVTMRAFLMSSGLSAPFIVTLAMQPSDTADVIQLALFVGLSGLASLISGPIWGKLSDKNSLWVMIVAGASCGVISLLAIAALLWAGKYQAWSAVALFFVLMVTHQGVRLGRKTYVVDMASGNKRTDYVALSNTLIGILLLIVGIITSALVQYSTIAVFAFFAVCCFCAVALGLLESRRSPVKSE